MTRTVILIPYRATDQWREKAFTAVHAQAQSLGYPVLIGDAQPPGEPFSIARTWNMLAQDAGEWDYLVRWGADFLLQDVRQVRRAVESLRGRDGYVSCADQAHRQTRVEARTGLVRYRGAPTYGAPSVVTRALWDRVGGFDERFVGWGHEDRAFLHGVRLLFGARTRVRGGQCVLWHPRTSMREPDEYMARRTVNHRLWKRIERIRDAEAWGHYLEHRYDSVVADG